MKNILKAMVTISLLIASSAYAGVSYCANGGDCYKFYYQSSVATIKELHIDSYFNDFTAKLSAANAYQEERGGASGNANDLIFTLYLKDGTVLGGSGKAEIFAFDHSNNKNNDIHVNVYHGNLGYVAQVSGYGIYQGDTIPVGMNADTPNTVYVELNKK